MANKLIDTYVKLVKSGKMSIDDVPDKYKEAVRKALED
jgi:hypothetical protein